ncbi:16S rRNA (cytosine(1402)-N(4))-methyltransferase RsmH [Helicobacter ailurogastricus]|uniref:16S rRNA (cytosine(1402)-N(4))-methyltransferase RsmH n=1 Tax=Helicobacter ailurogastricus TaxID=1578720 RepID=UPI002553DEF0|nr:16S rRNA (cytosine(1402)-N(4))-methyltransferase RsmH [Helicobacter ailurogastricus]
MHQSVLLEEVVAFFEPLSQKPQPVLVDCTLGLGGHTLALLEAYPRLRVIGIDRDRQASTLASERLAAYTDRFNYCAGNFATILPTLSAPIDGILADLGVSSLQLDSPHRGFGFHSLNLDMRMDMEQSLDAFKVVNHYSLYELERVLQAGEVREYKKIASLIVRQRHKQPFNTAQDLANFLAKHTHRGKLHPATLVFQAIRMEVNAEMQNLQTLLAYSKTLQDTLLCVIAFHSLEDRQVKHAFREYAKTYGEMLTKKPITPSPQEVRRNPRARSAKMRAFHFKALWCPPNP